MRQLYFALLLCVFVANAQTYTIKDQNFENALIELGYDIGNPDGNIESRNLNQVYYLDVSDKSIQDLSGIEAFVNLEVLIADNNQIRSLDLSNNTNLKELSVFNNRLNSLNVSNNPALEKLNVFNNRLSELILFNNRNLTYLAAADNNLTALDLVNNKRLEKIYCQNNQLTNLNASTLPFLEILNAEYNNLTDLDITNSENLVQLNVSNNNLAAVNTSTNTNLEQLNVLYNSITTIDASANTSLRVIMVAYNALESLNIRNGNNANIQLFRAEGNPDLICITTDDDTVSNNGNAIGRWNKDFSASYAIDCGASNTDNAREEEDNSFDGKAYNFFVGNDKTLNITSKRKATLNIINLQGISIVNSELKEGTNVISMSNALSNVYVLRINSGAGAPFTKKFILN